jgi:hypothetical protein
MPTNCIGNAVKQQLQMLQQCKILRLYVVYLHNISFLKKENDDDDNDDIGCTGKRTTYLQFQPAKVSVTRKNKVEFDHVFVCSQA